MQRPLVEHHRGSRPSVDFWNATGWRRPSSPRLRCRCARCGRGVSFRSCSATSTGPSRANYATTPERRPGGVHRGGAPPGAPRVLVRGRPVTGPAGAKSGFHNPRARRTMPAGELLGIVADLACRRSRSGEFGRRWVWESS
jgi:hypothetical protein